MNIILAISDDRAIRESLRAALAESDVLLFEARAEEAARRLISVQVDAIILDETPRVGPETVARLHQSVPTTPIIVLSSHSDAETQAGLRLAGACACLAKPFSCEALQQALQDASQRTEPVYPRAGGATGDVFPPRALGQYEMALRWLGRISGQIESPVRLSQTVADAMVDVFDAARSVVLLDTGDGVRVAASQGLAPSVGEQVRLDFDSGLMRRFEETAALVDRGSSHAMNGALKEMQLMGARLGVPLVCKGRVCGAVLVGEKASGRDYTSEEQGLLTVIGRCASASLENARLYQDLSCRQGSLNAVLANITTGVVAVLPDKTVAMMNQAAQRILQLNAVDIVGRSVQKLGSGFADIVLRTLADGKPRLREEVRDSAINAALGLSATPLDGNGVVVVFSRLPEERTDTENVAYSPFWEYLSSRVGQEIKNPMVAINTFAQLLPKKFDSEDFRHAFSDVVQKEVARINRVVETLFDFARHPRLILQRADVNETVRNVLRSFQEELDARQIKLETLWQPDLPAAELDPIFFAQALHNVVQNSIEAMPEGGTLRIKTVQQEDACEVVVADTGPGIREQDAPLVFMPFFSTKEQGMGLGLTIANRIMKQHHGDLVLQTVAEGGGTFAFRLPIAKTAYANHPSD